ncbi:MAG TPA: MotA/TolQ/ExbB proton channel family protein [Hyphomicrobium sp.]|nr:MotA/TolQ/ExbB proton channel family protein [Hyphomicrobium sp.]
MTNIETLLFEISKLFLTPVLVILLAMFAHALFHLGMLLVEAFLRVMRARGAQALHRFALAHPDAGQEMLELFLLKKIEPLRITSRVAPMLGLVATMIPMGPALVAVSSGDTQGIAENLVVAFSAVIVALLAAAITFTVLSVKRRWLLEELTALMSEKARATIKPADVIHPIQLKGAAHG